MPQILRKSGGGFDLTILEREGCRELHLTLRPLPGEDAASLMQRQHRMLAEHDAAVARQEVFGALQQRPAALQALQQQFGSLDWPITWVEGNACDGAAVAGTHVFAIAGTPVDTIRLDGRPIGRTFSDKHARYCLLGDVRPADTSGSPAEQARRGFETIEAALAQAGMVITDVARTWLFMDGILDWYGPFNSVRTDFFKQRRIFEHLVPASTGVSGRNCSGAALAAGAFATQPLNGAFMVRDAGSPLQCSALNYGSSFSRAVELRGSDHRRLMVSGTASIAQAGESIYENDTMAQIDLTMDVVQAILVANGVNWNDTSRVTAYFKNAADAPMLAEYCAQHDIPLLTPLLVHSDICRDELLFEIELDALGAC